MKLTSITWTRKPKPKVEKDLVATEFSFLQRPRKWALWGLSGIVVAATTAGLTESYNGLYNWFTTHGVGGGWGTAAPLMVDSFTIIGELAIFVAITGLWEIRTRVWPWISIALGLGASIAGNVGDKVNHPVSWQLTAAIPPLAGAFGIFLGLSVLKRYSKEVADRAFAASVVPGVVESAERPVPVRGIDALIPPRPVFSEPVPGAGIESGRTATEVSREFARSRIPEAKEHGIVGNDGIRQTGSFAAIS